MNVVISRMEDLPPGFEALRAASISQGFAFLDRLVERWRAGVYDDDADACVLAAFADEELAAIGAQTYDEYDPHPAHRRLRHFYVADRWRRRGVGRMLAGALTAEALRLAPRLHLRATRPDSIAFWDALGFQRVDRADRTHEKVRV